MDLNKACKCYLNFQVNKFGLKYNQLKNSVELFRNDINLGVDVKNIPPFLTPAIEINVDNCKIQLSLLNYHHESTIGPFMESAWYFLIFTDFPLFAVIFEYGYFLDR